MSRSGSALTGALTATMGVSALLTSGISALGPAVREGLMLSRSELSLFSLVVFITASATSIPWGLLADHLRPLWGITLTFFLAILGLSGAALAPNLAVLLVAALAGGCSLAISATVTNKLVSQFVAFRRRGRVLSTKQMGVQFAQVIAGFLFPAVAVYFGWRAGLAAGVLVAAIGLIIIVFSTRQSFEQQVEQPQRLVSSKNGTTNTRLLSAMVVYALVTALCFQSNLFGLPLMGYEELGFNVSTASTVVVVLGAVGFISRLVWGAFADRPFNIKMVMVALGAGLLAGELAIGLSVWLDVAWIFWLGSVLIGTFFALVPVVLSAVILQNFSAHRIGLISGVISVSTFAGFAAGPLLFGVVADTWSYQHSSAVIVVIAAVASLVPWLLPKNKPLKEIEVVEKMESVRKGA
ncbi:arabinose efflux permease family protein [Corynebacterium suranareeae]|uniref:Arabinose efflux permease family protein n=1 Tax=Corynebacterium suranareeae TaxID=2506452 RepID=A0A160PPB4_9CORY|nr:MFS transporter [Corynebacterium suranareeae]BAU94441.1 arabinose efflux permease family protein [Corynebacterium suranareeae]